MMYIKITCATLPAKRIINSFRWSDSYMEEHKNPRTTLDNQLFDITIIGGFKMEISLEDKRVALAPYESGIGWARLSEEDYETIEIGNVEERWEL